MRSPHIAIVVSCVAVLGAARDGQSQTIGPFVWQLQPYCNRVTITVTQTGSTFALNGFDDQCGGPTQASVTGTAFQNLAGSIGLGLTIVATPAGNPTHVDATVDLVTLSGTWRDSAGSTGTFAFNGAAGGVPRPTHARSGPLELRAIEFTLPELQFTGIGLTPNILARRSGGTPAAAAATLAGDVLLYLESAGYNGAAFTAPRAAITMAARENWGAAANGTSLSFSTTASGTTAMQTRMTVDHNGNVGIGTVAPLNPLHVTGSVRIGSCVYATDGGVACVSDARFKRNVRALPPTLDRLVGLQPVEYRWRTNDLRQQAVESEPSTGLVAQDVEQVLPELVTTDAQGYKAVNYGKLPLLAIQAIKELKEKNDALERRLAALEAALSVRR